MMVRHPRTGSFRDRGPERHGTEKGRNRGSGCGRTRSPQRSPRPGSRFGRCCCSWNPKPVTFHPHRGARVRTLSPAQVHTRSRPVLLRSGSTGPPPHAHRPGRSRALRRPHRRRDLAPVAPGGGSRRDHGARDDGRPRRRARGPMAPPPAGAAGGAPRTLGRPPRAVVRLHDRQGQASRRTCCCGRSRWTLTAGLSGIGAYRKANGRPARPAAAKIVSCSQLLDATSRQLPGCHHRRRTGPIVAYRTR
jgi:hypothetical protein